MESSEALRCDGERFARAGASFREWENGSAKNFKIPPNFLSESVGFCRGDALLRVAGLMNRGSMHINPTCLDEKQNIKSIPPPSGWILALS
jgi:hypothetical protein